MKSCMSQHGNTCITESEVIPEHVLWFSEQSIPVPLLNENIASIHIKLSTSWQICAS